MDKSSRSKVYEFEDFRLDALHLMLYRGGEEISVPPKAVETLLVLVERRGEIVSKDELMKAIWTDAVVEESNLAQYLHLLRKTLGETKDGKPFIETFRRRGYRFNGDVKASKQTTAEIGSGNSSRHLSAFQTRTDGGAVREATTGNIIALADWRGVTKDEDKSPEAVSLEAPEERSEGVVKRRRFSLTAAIVLGIFVLVLAVFALYRYVSKTSTAAAPIESIAVLPFENATGNADLDYLSDGLSESVIDRLSQLPQLKVIARTSSFKYRGQNVDLQTAAAKLGARAIVTGRIMQRGDSLTIRVEMIDALENRQLWSEQFNRRAADALGIQEEIARTASEKLRLKLTGAENQRLAKTYTENQEAYRLYLRGRFLEKKFTPPDVLKSIEYYEQAIALDPKFALAYDAHANATARMMSFIDVPQKDYQQQTREYTLKALSIDDELPEAHASLGGMLSGSDYDFAGAERELLRAIELNPNLANAHFWYGQLLSNFGRHEEALAEIERGAELDPVSLETNVYKAEALFYARRYDESINEAKKTVELDDNYFPAHAFLVSAYEMKGDYAASIAERIKLNELVGASQRAEAIRRSFEKGGWEGFVRDATAENPPFNVPPYIAAALCALTGEKDKAFAILNQLYENRSPQLVVIKVDPRLDNLRDDPRFADLLRRVGLL